MKKPRVCVLRTAGTNCDMETAHAFSFVGAQVSRVHINALIAGSQRLADFDILALPGGFSYGDDLGAGKILANELKYSLLPQLRAFIKQGKLIIGICNGFQILVKSGLLPGNKELTQEASLILNDSAKFEDRWVYLKSLRSPAGTKCVWTRDLPEVIYLPVAHGEGKFITQDKAVLERLQEKGQIVLQYCTRSGAYAGYPHNPNGSLEHIAGICDETGRIFGLMPHPERHIDCMQHPRHERAGKGGSDGILIFKNGVDYARRNG